MKLSARNCSLALVVFSIALGLAANTAWAANLDLSAYRGKVVYLDFWASWCAPCRLSFPWMNEIQEARGRDGLVIVAVNVDHDRAAAQEFLEATSPEFRIVYDPDGTIASQFNFKDMPTSLLIGRDGKVRYTHAGFLRSNERAYLADIDLLLSEKAR
jgi:cytochrome c biogenesis protein CcmG/thiol:disulfide interchange protein DsbE